MKLMRNPEDLKNFYKGKKVLVTGHTGFKGSYLCVLLSMLGADVYGYSLPAPTEPSLFETLYGKGSSTDTRKDLKLQLGGENGARDVSASDDAETAGDASVPAVKNLTESHIGDVRDFEELNSYVNRTDPDVIIHMAAQPIVRESYRIPRETFEANVMGTVNLLESVRRYREAPAKESAAAGSRAKPVSFLNVTTDKVYLNEEKDGYAYKEDDKLDGYDPYSNSKSCSELVTHSYKAAFFGENKDNMTDAGDAIVRISTARAGNVIGGGDFAKDRLIPDCMRAYLNGGSVGIRNPFSTRPYQHVLEPLTVYLTIAMEQYLDADKQGYYNVGPDLCDCVTTGELADLFAKYATGFAWENQAEENAPHEANFLRLDNTKIKETFGWQPNWHIGEAVEASVRWSDAYRLGAEASNRELLRQIVKYMK